MKLWGTLIAFFICLHQHYGNSAEIEETAAQQSDSPMTRETRGGLNMLRLGRSGRYRTRGVRMLRLGKRSDPLDSLTYDDLKDILYSLYDTEKHPMVRQPPLPRYGRELDLLDEPVAKRMSPNMALQLLEAEAYGSHMRPAPRLGRFKRSPDSSENELAVDVAEDGSASERAVPIPRFGRLVDADEKEKSEEGDKDGGERAVPMPRIGREKDEEEALENDKRGLAMLRLGRSMKMLRLGKREPALFEEPADKRSLALLRLGKRGMKMLRLGKREPGLEEDKRSLKLLRLGKRENADHQVETRALSMLRLGRSQTDDKRSLKLLRLG